MQTRYASLAFLSLLLATACGTTDAPPAAPAEHVLDSAALAELPALPVSEGSLLCTAIGTDECPLETAAANRLDGERIALWEPGSVIRVWRAGDTMGTPIGRTGGDESQYRLAIAVRAAGDRYRVITADSGWRRLDIGRDGTLLDQAIVPVRTPLTLVGYVGDQAVRQRMHGWNVGDGGRLTVTLLESATDTAGRDILVTPVRWLIGGTQSTPPLPPYIAASPSWALNPGDGFAWSPGDSLVVEYRDLDDRLRWRLRGPAGPPVTERDMTLRESAVREASRMLPLIDEDFTSMRDRSDSVHPAVSALAVTPDGEVVVALATVPSRDSIDYLRLAADGRPIGRFTLERRVRILIAEGDSLLVHRPTEGEPWEVRWLTMDVRR